MISPRSMIPIVHRVRRKNGVSGRKMRISIGRVDKALTMRGMKAIWRGMVSSCRLLLRYRKFYIILVQWAVHQPTPKCQNFTMELEPYHIVI